MLGDRLCQIGFTSNESKLYIELLKIGSQPVSIIAKRVKLNRTTTYSLLKSLMRRGVVGFHKKNNVKYFHANDPNCLVAYLDSKCRTFDYYRSEFLSFVPKFRNLQDHYDFKRPTVAYYDGLEGVKQVVHDVFNYEGQLRGYFPLQKWFAHDLRQFLEKYMQERIEKEFLLKAIVPNDFKYGNFLLGKNENSFVTALCVARENFSELFKSQINIYDNKVSIISLDKGSEYGVMIESKEVMEMQKSIFEMAWKGCKLALNSKRK